MANPVNNETDGLRQQSNKSDLAKIGVTMNIKTYDGATSARPGQRPQVQRDLLRLGHVLQPVAEHGLYQRQGVQSRPEQLGVQERQIRPVDHHRCDGDGPPPKLKAAYSELNDLVLDEDFVYLVTVSPPLMLTKANVQGIQWTAHESPWYADVWLDR